MKRALQTARAFSQQALRQLEPVASGRSVSGGGAATSSAKKPLELDGRSYLLPTLTLSRTAARKLGEAHVHFQTRARKTPIVLDLQMVSSDGSPHAQPIKRRELRAEIDQLQLAGFVPVGITNASDDIKQLAAEMHLPYFISTRQQQQQQATATSSLQEPQAPVASGALELQQSLSSSPAAASNLPPLVVATSVRSGQQIYAQNRSLVVLGNVNSGAEVLADDDVVVLGALKGRALAGIGGNVDARIVCQSFDAELVSIAHHFTTCDALDAMQKQTLRPLKPTIVSLQDDHLAFESTAL